MKKATASSDGFSQAVEQAWKGQLPLLTLFEIANALSQDGHESLAAVLYQTWLQRNRTSHDHLVLFNLGVILFSQGDLDGALSVYSKALRLAPGFLQPRFNLGLVYERLGCSDSAVAQWLRIETTANAEDPAQRALLILALNNLGRHYEDLGRYSEALAALTKSLRLQPDQADAIHHWVFLRAKQCVWPVYESIGSLDEPALRKYTSALAMISLSEDPYAQLAAAQNYVKSKVDCSVKRLSQARSYRHDKIRLAYCSSDLCLHPVAMLTVELFELHDRDCFEVYVFDWSREDGSSLRQRVIDGVDHFERIHHLSDADAAKLIRDREIDILIDLQGQTLGARPGILAYRPAPVQVTYLGLPATTGLPFIDYVIADKFLIPEDAQAYYTEKPLYMPDAYQASDRKRVCGRIPTRSECGLPEQSFVFCSFNNNYKFTPEVFSCWLRILKQVEGSVLWLLADNVWSRDNLVREALAQGISADRLIFAPRVAPPDYLARYAVADVFLDTFPFNAGTTANDALWMGLPILTMSGRTFASRMAGALLTATGLPELITHNLADYERKAIRLANDPEALKAIREKLAKEREDGVLFDTPRFVRHLEENFKRLIKDID